MHNSQMLDVRKFRKAIYSRLGNMTRQVILGVNLDLKIPLFLKGCFYLPIPYRSLNAYLPILYRSLNAYLPILYRSLNAYLPIPYNFFKVLKMVQNMKNVKYFFSNKILLFIVVSDGCYYWYEIIDQYFGL